MNRILGFLVALTFMSVPAFAVAGPIVRSGDTISVDAEQMLKGDFYALGGMVTISGTAENDAYIAGGTVTVNAPITEDLTIVGGVVQVHGDVGDDVRIMGGEVTIAKAVTGDVVVLGGTLTILSTATVGGDVLFMGGDLTIEGDVAGAVYGTSKNLRINADVGDVSFAPANSFIIGGEARIRGNVSYMSYGDVVRAQDAEIVGTINKTTPRLDTDSGAVRFFIVQICILLFGALSLYLLTRARVQGVVEQSVKNIGLSGLIGLGVFIVVPFVSTVLLVSVIGSFVGIILFALYILGLILSLVLAGVAFGHILEKSLTKRGTVTIRTLILGIILYTTLGLIPYVGGFLIFAGMLVLLGALSQSLYRLIRG